MNKIPGFLFPLCSRSLLLNTLHLTFDEINGIANIHCNYMPFFFRDELLGVRGGGMGRDDGMGLLIGSLSEET